MKNKRILIAIRFLIMSVLAGSLVLSGCGPGQLFGPTITPTVTPTASITPTPTVGPGGFPLKFHVEGNAFVDQFGQKMIFRGLDMYDIFFALHPDWQKQISWNEHYFEVMASWGARIVRVPIYPHDVRFDGWPAIFNVLDQTIAWAGENKMYVDIDFQSIGWIPDNWFADDMSVTNQREFLDFWDRMSERYASNDIVAFYELFSEPVRSGYEYFGSAADWQVWKGLAEQAIAVIRANDPDKIILVGGLQGAYNLSYTADNPVEGKNIGYATHTYPEQIQSGPNLDAAFGNLSENYPVVATELGCADGNRPYSQAIIDYLEEHQISWMPYGFQVLHECVLLDEKFYPDIVPNYQGWYFRSRLLYELEDSPKPRPGNFTKTSPMDGSDSAVSNPALNWSDSIHADSYEYCINPGSFNACASSWISTGTATNAALSGLTVGATYSWQVRATNSYGTTEADEGDWGTFTVSR